MTQSNEQEKGRAVPPLETHTFDTGITVRLRKISPLLTTQVKRSFPPPKPPVNRVDYGDGKVKMELNPSDPEYLEQLSDYNIQLNERIQRMMIKRGVEVDIDHEALTQLRAEMAELGIDLDTDDHIAYVSYICVGSSEDLKDLLRKITHRSQPTQEAIAEATASF